MFWAIAGIVVALVGGVWLYGLGVFWVASGSLASAAKEMTCNLPTHISNLYHELKDKFFG